MSRITAALNRAGAGGSGPSETTPAIPWVFETAEVPRVPKVPMVPQAPDAPQALQALQVPEAPQRPPRVEPGRGTLTRSVVKIDIPQESLDKLVLSPELPTHVVEQYRRLGATLHQAQRDQGVRIVMITSAVPHEGKTLVASNLALVLSTSYGRSVLLVDGDLRRPTVHTVFGVSNTRGIADALKEDTADALVPLQVTPNLSLLVAGTPQSDPMRIVTGAGMQRLLASSAEKYDWVLLDSPPIAILSDAHLLAAGIDKAVIVIEAGRTPYEAIQKAIDTVGPERIIGAVLNRADGAEMSPYGEYGYYYGPSPDLTQK
jgi:capsular exopolysaccharide synthesis family protein